MVKNLKGNKYGRLTVIEQHGFTKPNRHNRRYAVWYCKCECGNFIEMSTSVLTNKKYIHSCGCRGKEHLQEMIANNKTHGMTNTRLYRIYKGMIARCYYECSQRYNAYGGRGIRVCDDWKSDRKKFFEWAIKNGYSEDLTIERINVNGNYEPSNCCWIPMKEQYKNKQSNAKPLPPAYVSSSEIPNN